MSTEDTEKQGGISRRRFIAGIAAAVSAGCMHDAKIDDLNDPSNAMDRVKAIDTHTHFYDPGRPGGIPWPRKGDSLYRAVLPGDFTEVAAKHNVQGTVVVEASPLLEDNQWILDLARENKQIVGFIGNLKVGTAEFKGNLERFGANELFRGIRLRGRDIERGLGVAEFESDISRLADRSMTIDVLGGSKNLSAVADLAGKFPGLRIVIDHLPFKGYYVRPEQIRHELKSVAGRENIYAKVSNVLRKDDGRVIQDVEYYRPGLDVLWDMFGDERVIFGSNWPVCERVGSYDQVYNVVADYLSTKGNVAEDKYFRANSKAAYSWIERL